MACATWNYCHHISHSKHLNERIAYKPQGLLMCSQTLHALLSLFYTSINSPLDQTPSQRRKRHIFKHNRDKSMTVAYNRSNVYPVLLPESAVGSRVPAQSLAAQIETETTHTYTAVVTRRLRLSLALNYIYYTQMSSIYIYSSSFFIVLDRLTVV